MIAIANRAVRRHEAAKIDRYRRRAGRALETALVEAGAPLDGHPHACVFRKAIAELYRNPKSVRCFVCAEGFASGWTFGAFLLSCAAHRPTIASASAICLDCWRDKPFEEIEAEAARLLRRIVPGGAFVDAREAQQ